MKYFWLAYPDIHAQFHLYKNLLIAIKLRSSCLTKATFSNAPPTFTLQGSLYWYDRHGKGMLNIKWFSEDSTLLLNIKQKKAWPVRLQIEVHSSLVIPGLYEAVENLYTCLNSITKINMTRIIENCHGKLFECSKLISWTCWSVHLFPWRKEMSGRGRDKGTEKSSKR